MTCHFCPPNSYIKRIPLISLLYPILQTFIRFMFIAKQSHMSMFPDPRRIVTGHDDKGRSIVVADSTIPCEPTPINCNFAVLYETHKFPASNNEWVDPATTRTADLSNKDGVVLRVVDFPPNTATVSICSRSICSSFIFHLEAMQVFTRNPSADKPLVDISSDRIP